MRDPLHPTHPPIYSHLVSVDSAAALCSPATGGALAASLGPWVELDTWADSFCGRWEVLAWGRGLG